LIAIPLAVNVVGFVHVIVAALVVTPLTVANELVTAAGGSVISLSSVAKSTAEATTGAVMFSEVSVAEVCTKSVVE
jgi:hypothetical protein